MEISDRLGSLTFLKKIQVQIGSAKTIPSPNKKITDPDTDTCAKFTFIVEVLKVSKKALL